MGKYIHLLFFAKYMQYNTHFPVPDGTPFSFLRPFYLLQIPELFVRRFPHSGWQIIFFATPFYKFCHCLRKNSSILQILVIHMNHFMDTVMNPVVHLCLDQTLKAIHNFFLFIQFRCTDFYDFERQTAVEPAFTVLIPAESELFVCYFTGGSVDHIPVNL